MTGRRAEQAESRRTGLASAIVAAIRATMDRQILTVPDDALATFTKAGPPGHDWGLDLSARHSGQRRPILGAAIPPLRRRRLAASSRRLLRGQGRRHPGTATSAAAPAKRASRSTEVPLAQPERPTQPVVLGFIPALISRHPPINQQLSSSQRLPRTAGRPGTRPAALKVWLIAPAGAGLVVCALVDGKGWSERPGALVDVVIATDGRTYSLQTMKQKPPSASEIAGLRIPCRQSMWSCLATRRYKTRRSLAESTRGRTARLGR